MTLVYFESDGGTMCIDSTRIVGIKQKRVPTNYPTLVMLDCHPYEVSVRNSYDDAQARVLAAKEWGGT